ncbi:hypothetical protein FLK61_35215 [Paenalkalicoccus suaedae]|uniref:Uncharacterized protein n=1 Tax=Paenalkalicoccus suaedae TaxID=2592382 RepID=A0A859FGH7_9BACI|nr:hypothetical protein [Paenalkalicoccus suaedae]QKS71920.1 hypothetical protein FLK61_35215 [Paenalkalicoccus suaedae]
MEDAISLQVVFFFVTVSTAFFVMINSQLMGLIKDSKATINNVELELITLRNDLILDYDEIILRQKMIYKTTALINLVLNHDQILNNEKFDYRYLYSINAENGLERKQFEKEVIKFREINNNFSKLKPHLLTMEDKFYYDILNKIKYKHKNIEEIVEGLNSSKLNMHGNTLESYKKIDLNNSKFMALVKQTNSINWKLIKKFRRYSVWTGTLGMIVPIGFSANTLLESNFIGLYALIMLLVISKGMFSLDSYLDDNKQNHIKISKELAGLDLQIKNKEKTISKSYKERYVSKGFIHFKNKNLVTHSELYFVKKN